MTLHLGLGFASNMTGSYNPIATGTTLQLYFDKFYTIPAAVGTVGFPVNLNFSIKCRHLQKFDNTGPNSTTGESVYLLCQSDIAAGTAAPVIAGNFEVFFDPM